MPTPGPFHATCGKGSGSSESLKNEHLSVTRSVSLYSSSVMASDVKVMGSGAHKGKIIARLSTSRLDYLIWEHTHAHQSYYYIYNISITLYIHACIVQYTCETLIIFCQLYTCSPYTLTVTVALSLSPS